MCCSGSNSGEYPAVGDSPVKATELATAGNCAVADITAHLSAFEVYLIGGLISGLLCQTDGLAQTDGTEHAASRHDHFPLLVHRGTGMKSHVRVHR